MQRGTAPNEGPIPQELFVSGMQTTQSSTPVLNRVLLNQYGPQVSRGLLPDAGSEFEGHGGNINDAMDFLLVNFTEMNKLWVRMQHQGSNRDK